MGDILDQTHQKSGGIFDKKHLLIGGVVVVAIVAFLFRKHPSTPSTSTNDPNPNLQTQMSAPIYWGYQGDTTSIGGGDNTPVSTTMPTPPGGTIITPTPQPVTPTPQLPQPPTSPPQSTPVAVQTPGAVIPVPTYVNPVNDKNVARQEINQVNTYMAAAAAQHQVTQPMQNQLHTQKVQAAAVIGESVDSWGVARTSTGAIDFGTSAGFTPQTINSYVQNTGNLSASNLAQLHQQKVAEESALGNTTTSDGHVFDKSGRPVGKNGMG